ncbi:MAG: 5-(carboxyamino)imidazole ribonucleotide mutase [Nitrospirae bacterium CG_4_10_14_0_8_um_filter_41_23]|nr:5-(carboxyamino)imidazole ribonucleotide mutase [Nitrospirota bacterium]OIP61027.1 MAG: 5-(carboxyamino)imidazole ribonucleotide mutase [Nitrospirae bacterium CG2_30_41_42]PIQ94161.1 MAG: 5-(carboxyamino)imidazole ribonucleotide mutase [Nitrospirae bacterium CG11_big_fil_rev_8_21_14_0_20_41_14]PIV44444.1 MAG: 5-(carboxyamino)imidazole ribonucleotide mutase [Nitrospirae bacterium CG02_land_8_20_14_3_00_41_53]PIW87713.1 MAG: 5-(carboxyamino)imidazole ribonucleotide mutase [Nitrospirae bacteriu
MKTQVLIVMGSDSDMPVMDEAGKILKKLGISYKTVIASAHITPELTIRLASEAEEKGIEVIIAGAGMAAHLAGVIAAHTIVPVIGVPIDSSPLNGLDSLLSTVQMPPGVPVATMAIGKAGAKNAAILSAQIIGRKDPEVVKRLKDYRRKMAGEVEKKSRTLQGYNS